MISTNINKLARETILHEADAIGKLVELLNSDFEKAIDTILSTKGRVIVTGIGKSAIIAQKIVATFNSTGTPSVFMHAADAIHGDLGIVQKEDVVICLSKSGNTPEIKVLVPLLKMQGNKLIAIVGNPDSYLAKQADFVLYSTVDKEACPNNLAPTSSTTAQLVMGDALAVCLLECRGFTMNDFARYHPGGSLGKQLYLKVSDLYKNNEVPKVNPDDDIRAVILEISSKRLGATVVVENNKIVGIITDGDIRRMVQKNENVISILKLKAKDIMCVNPKTIDIDTLAVDALQIMRSHSITQIIVTKENIYQGIVHLHDIINEGII